VRFDGTLFNTRPWYGVGHECRPLGLRKSRTRYLYDALNRRAGVIYPDGSTKHFERDARGNLSGIVGQNRNRIHHQFDALNRLVKREVSLGDDRGLHVEQYHYDGINRLVAAIANGTQIIRRYDSLSRILEETQDDHTIRYAYDAAGNRTSIHYPGGQEIKKSYDVLRRVCDVREQTGVRIAGYGYHSAGKLEKQTLGDDIEVTFAYDQRRRGLTEIAYHSAKEDRLIDGNRYAYDLAGNRVHEAPLHRGDHYGERYSYDLANRLTGVHYGVANLDDPESAFERQVDYELNLDGTWQSRIA
jgi:YD repeat-containing protein